MNSFFSDKKKKILLADDDPAICEGISMILEESGHEVTTVTDGQIVQKVGEYNPDIILLDIWMSGMDGRDICTHLKNQEKTKHIPIIMVSANRDTKGIALECGADDFIAKPFEMKDLLQKVESFS